MDLQFALLLSLLGLLGREVAGNAIRERRSEDKQDTTAADLAKMTPEELKELMDTWGNDARTIYKTRDIGEVRDLAPPGDYGTINVYMQLWLRRIDDLDVEHGILNGVAWLYMRWNDSRWEWEKDHDIPKMVLPAEKVWKPDMRIFNDDAENGHHTFMDRDIRITVTSRGEITYVVPIHYHVASDNIKHEEPKEGDVFSCYIRIGSWTFPGRRLNPILDGNGIGDLTKEHQNYHWNVTSTSATITNQVYGHDPNTYPYVDFNIQLEYHADGHVHYHDHGDHDHDHDHHDHGDHGHDDHDHDHGSH